MKVLGADYEIKVMDFARKTLDDIPECASADYSVRWSKHPNGEIFPFLVLAFHLPETRHQPALGIALVTVRKDTLFDVMPGKLLYEGDRLRDHIRRSTENYLQKHGIRLPEVILGES